MTRVFFKGAVCKVAKKERGGEITIEVPLKLSSKIGWRGDGEDLDPNKLYWYLSRQEYKILKDIGIIEI